MAEPVLARPSTISCPSCSFKVGIFFLAVFLGKEMESQESEGGMGRLVPDANF